VRWGGLEASWGGVDSGNLGNDRYEDISNLLELELELGGLSFSNWSEMESFDLNKSYTAHACVMEKLVPGSTRSQRLLRCHIRIIEYSIFFVDADTQNKFEESV